MTREDFVSARRGAVFAGFEPGDEPNDKEMRRFYAWVRAHRVPTHRRGPRQLVFRLSELEAAIQASSGPAAPERAVASITRMERLAHEHVLRVMTGGKP